MTFSSYFGAARCHRAVSRGFAQAAASTAADGDQQHEEHHGRAGSSHGKRAPRPAAGEGMVGAEQVLARGHAAPGWCWGRAGPCLVPGGFPSHSSAGRGEAARLRMGFPSPRLPSSDQLRAQLTSPGCGALILSRRKRRKSKKQSSVALCP